MAKTLALVSALLAPLASLALHAQNTTITASALKAKGANIASGMVTFTPIDARAKAVPFSSSGLNAPQALACTITNGALSACSVPDLCQAQPPNLKYQITITIPGFRYALAAVANVCGATWPLDAYVPPATTSSYTPISSSYGAAVPSGACPNAAEYVRNGNGGELYICVNTAWVLVSGAGGGGGTDPGALQKSFNLSDLPSAAIARANLGVSTANVGDSDLTDISASQGEVTVVASAPDGKYRISYYAAQNGTCTTGSNSVYFSFQWTDASHARTTNSVTLALTSTQSANLGSIQGVVPIFVSAATAITYTSTVSGSCTSGTSSYDVHMSVESVE